MRFMVNRASTRMAVSTLVIGLGGAAPLIAQVRPTGEVLANSPDAGGWPTQVVVRVGFPPTPFHTDGGKSRIMYELYLTNFSNKSYQLRSIEAYDANKQNEPPIARFAGEQLASMVRPVGALPEGDTQGVAPSISAGGTVVVFLSLTLRPGLLFPTTMAHRISFGSSVVDGASMTLRHTVLTLGKPVDGPDWIAADGPNEDPDNHHRRGILIIDGEIRLSRRYAIDWKQMHNGVSFKGNSHDDRSYYAYAKPVRAVADARVVATRDGMPDNPPGHGKDFHPAIPITFDNVGGNTIVLDLGNGQFAQYFHLRPGSVRVKVGDHVRLGQAIGLIGSSGDAREPHLHFEVTTSAAPLKGEGVPYVISSFDIIQGPGKSIRRLLELPVGGTMVNFDRLSAKVGKSD